MKEVIAFRVVGIPKPKGSLRPVAKGVLKEQLSDALVTWGEAVAAAVREHRPAEPIQGAVEVVCQFFLPRPKKPASPWPIAWRRNDVDKLARTILDHLTSAMVIEDDAQVVRLVASKQFGDPGAEITVAPVEPLTSLPHPSMLPREGARA